jgi:plasmid stabilization system protein ParE
MPRIILTEGAALGLERCRQFLATRNPQAAQRAAQAIQRQISLLERNAEIRRPFEGWPDLRELVIAFGESGYVALYRHDPAADTVYLLAFRHQRGSGLLIKRSPPSFTPRPAARSR